MRLPASHKPASKTRRNPHGTPHFPDRRRRGGARHRLVADATGPAGRRAGEGQAAARRRRQAAALLPAADHRRAARAASRRRGSRSRSTIFAGGARSLQSLVGGSVDVVTGAYEHTIRMQAKGQDIRAVIELGRFPAIVIAVRKEKAAQFKSAADLKGAKIGVTAPGSSTALLAQYAMVKAGLKADRCRDHRRRRRRERRRGDEEGRDRRDLASRSGDRQARGRRRRPGPDRHPHRERHARPVRRLEPGGGALHEAGFHREEPEHHAASRQRLHEGAEVDRERHAGADRRSVPPEYHLGDKPLYLKAVANSKEATRGRALSRRRAWRARSTC